MSLFFLLFHTTLSQKGTHHTSHTLKKKITRINNEREERRAKSNTHTHSHFGDHFEKTFLFQVFQSHPKKIFLDTLCRPKRRKRRKRMRKLKILKIFKSHSLVKVEDVRFSDFNTTHPKTRKPRYGTTRRYAYAFFFSPRNLQ